MIYLSNDFAKIFVRIENFLGEETMTEIQNGDVFLIENYESITELSIILGTDDVLPSVEFISPLPYQIFNINKQHGKINI